jgi:hypothetical protein
LPRRRWQGIDFFHGASELLYEAFCSLGQPRLAPQRDQQVIVKGETKLAWCAAHRRLGHLEGAGSPRHAFRPQQLVQDGQQIEFDAAQPRQHLAGRLQFDSHRPNVVHPAYSGQVKLRSQACISQPFRNQYFPDARLVSRKLDEPGPPIAESLTSCSEASNRSARSVKRTNKASRAVRSWSDNPSSRVSFTRDPASTITS